MRIKHMGNSSKATDIDALYRAVGEFVVTFEHVCHSIQICITFLLSKEGLKNQQATHIVLAGLTADPLRTLFESLVGELVDMNDLEKRMLKDVVNRFQKLTEQRNDVVHCTWFIGWGNGHDTDYSVASGEKLHKTKSGASLKSFELKVSDFASLTEEARALAYIFRRLNGCFLFGHKIEKNFVVSEGGLVSVPPGTMS